MDNQPLISVIVPIYKVEDYLDRCVDSIVNQTYRNLEIILVDDGSPDNCPRICDDWGNKDSRIKVIHKENGGLSDARNAGMKIASGKYISFIDSDDLVSVGFLERLISAILDTDSEVAACDVLSFNREEELDNAYNEKAVVNALSSEQALSQLINGIGIRAVAWNKLYKARLLKNESFEYSKLHEDEFFTYRIIDKCNCVAYVDVPLYYYRQREGSIMSAMSIRHLDGLEAGLQRLELLANKYPELYHKDKITFCIGCIGSYRMAINGRLQDSRMAKKKIKGFRRKISFSMKELYNYSFRERLYAVFSSPCLIGVFCRIKK